MITKFTLCLLGAATVAADVDTDASMKALTRMRSLSHTLYTHETGALLNAGPDIVEELVELSEIVDEIPGVSWIIS